MSEGLDLEIRGLAEAQESLRKALEAMDGPTLSAIIAKATLRAHRYASQIVHVDTGRLKNSLFPRVHGRNQAYGVVGTNVAYAPYEHERGGSHAFLERTVNEEGQAILDQIAADIEKAALG